MDAKSKRNIRAIINARIAVHLAEIEALKQRIKLQKGRLKRYE